ncbi:pyridoxamine 5'-phosphate oxidase family protein [Tsukamurella soli]|uniref:Pyridoxamine 5'-phosphate oxidase family protein n=1 Tax=Tsukamurella soli TaxID=644556 RepID=A0ABP8JNP5_9ACTN
MPTTDTAALSVDQAWERLSRENIGRLVTLISGGVIDVYPINYVCRGHTILIRTHPGMKLATLAVFPDVVFEVDHHAPGQAAWSVVVRATARIVTDSRAVTAADGLGLHPLVDGDADEIVVLVPTALTAREFPTREIAEETR